MAYGQLTERFGSPVYKRVDTPATPAQKSALGGLSASVWRPGARRRTDQRDPDRGRQRRADRRPQGHHGVRLGSRPKPSGTENVAKVYAESFKGGTTSSDSGRG